MLLVTVLHTLRFNFSTFQQNIPTLHYARDSIHLLWTVSTDSVPHVYWQCSRTRYCDNWQFSSIVKRGYWQYFLTLHFTSDSILFLYIVFTEKLPVLCTVCTLCSLIKQVFLYSELWLLTVYPCSALWLLTVFLYSELWLLILFPYSALFYGRNSLCALCYWRYSQTLQGVCWQFSLILHCGYQLFTTIADVAKEMWWMSTEVFILVLWLINLKKDNNKISEECSTRKDLIRK